MAGGLPGLLALSEAARGVIPVSDELSAAYAVRQVHLALRCQHACAHCFSSAPPRGPQMSLKGFSRLAREFGEAAQRVGKPYGFLFLGSATDPSSVEKYATYQDAWLAALPSFSPIRVYTHGWILEREQQRQEFDKFLDSLARGRDKVESVNLSMDGFSSLARTDWVRYRENMIENLIGVSKVLPRSRILLEFLFPPDYGLVSPRATLSYWKVLAKEADAQGSLESAFRHFIRGGTGLSDLSRDLFALVEPLGAAVGWTLKETLSRTRDDGVPMSFGRGRSLLENFPQQVKDAGLQSHRAKSWKRLDPVGELRGGIQLYPDGRCRLVDYDGYRLGAWLANGRRVIPYL